MKDFSQLLFGIDLILRFKSLDHSSAIANAFLAIWHGVRLLNCWSHMVRKSKDKAALLNDQRYYDDVIDPHLL